MAKLPVQIILASGSMARRTMLTNAGVTFDVVPADVDETAIRDDFLRTNGAAEPAQIATILAHAKAINVSNLHPGALVIGSDQVLNLEATLLHKPETLAAARETLIALRGRVHQLNSAVALAIDGAVIWSTSETACLTVRTFSDEFLADYLAAEGCDLLEAVGAYKLEGRGLQLFERIEGNHFTILGMPLLPLLAELRARGMIAS